MELHALAGMNENNGKQVHALLESYRKMMFPGAEKDSQQEHELEAAKKALAAEASKVLVVRKLEKGAALPGRMHPELQRLGQAHASDLERERLKQQQRRRRRKK